VAQNWLSLDRGLFGGDLNTLTFESFGALNLNTGGGNDDVTLGILYDLAWTPFTDSSANPQIAPPLTIDLGAGDDALDLTNLEFSSFDPDTSLFSSLAPDPGRFHLLAGASAVQVRMGAGNDTVEGGLAVTGSITVADNRIGSENPGVNTVNLTGGVGNWIDASSLGFGAGEQGVSVTLSEPGGPGTGLLTSSIAGHQTTITGISNVRASSGNDAVTANDTANIVDLGTGTDHADLAGQETARHDMVAFSGANGGLAIDLTAGTATGGTGSGLVNATFSGAEGAFGSNFADTIDCSAANDFIFGLGGNDTTDCGDGDSDIAGFTGLFDDYSIVQNLDGTFTVTDLRTPAELPVGVVSDGVDTCSDVEIFRFADQLVCADATGSADFFVNASDRRTGLLPERIVGGQGAGDSVKVRLEPLTQGQSSIEITPTPSPSGGDQGAIFMALLFGIGMVVEEVEDIEIDSTSNNAVFADIHGDFTDTDLAENTLTLNTGAGDDNLDASGVTSNHRVVMNAGGGADTLLGGAGADILNGGAGNDTMAGGTGDDSYVTDGGDTIVEAVNAGTDTVQSSLNYTLGSNLENLTLIGSALIGSGNTLANTITGNALANTLSGGTGADRLVGGLGNDVYVTDGGDTIAETANQGTDLVQSSVSFSLGSNLENLTLTGAAAINGYGNTLNNVITGNGAANLLDGRTGADRLAGGAGNDSYITDGGDVIAEAANQGTDVVRSSVSYALGSNLENLTLTGAAAINGYGNTLNNVITGNGAANLLDGRTGADRLAGGAGNDSYITDGGDAIVEAAGQGTDVVRSSTYCTLAANVENLVLTGAANVNGLGNTLANTLVGNTGANVLNGASGNDILTGGAGADAFLFNTVLNASTNVDRITDFSVVADTMRLDNAVMAGLGATLGTLAAAKFWKSTAGLAHDADDRIIYDTDSGRLFYDANGSAAGGAVHFATIGVSLALTNADFVVV